MKFLSHLILLAVLVATGSTTSLAGEAYYRWTDKWGNPVLSDRLPPKGTNYEVINSERGLKYRVNSAESVAPAKIEPPIEKQAQKADKNTIITRPDKDPVLCELAKSNLNALNTRAQIKMKNEKGEYNILTEEEKEAKRTESLSQIEALCE